MGYFLTGFCDRAYTVVILDRDSNLWQEERSKFVAFARSRGSRDPEAVVQSAYLKAWRAHERIDPEHFIGLMMTIVHREFIDQARKNHEQMTGLPEEILADAPGPLETLVSEEERESLQTAIQKLAEPTRSTVRAYLREEPYQIIAAREKLPERTIRKRVSRTRLALKHYFLPSDER